MTKPSNISIFKSLSSYFVIFLLIFSFNIYLAKHLFAQSKISKPKNVWEELESDLKILNVELANQSFFKSEILLFKTKLENFKLEIVKATQIGRKTSSVKQIANKLNAKLVINASFFDENHNPIGLIIRNGIKINRLHSGGKIMTGIFEINRQRINIVNRKLFTQKESLWALQAGPQLIINGAKNSKLLKSEKYARRSGICITNTKELILYITTGIRGFSFRELMDILQKEPINCLEALNLDGGGSSQLYLKTKNTKNTKIIDNNSNIFIPGQEDIPVVLALFDKK